VLYTNIERLNKLETVHLWAKFGSRCQK